jgi:hypothetical protein
MTAARINSSVYLPEASCTLSNLASYFYKYVPNREKSLEYAVETIAIVLPIMDEVPFYTAVFPDGGQCLEALGLVRQRYGSPD